MSLFHFAKQRCLEFYRVEKTICLPILTELLFPSIMRVHKGDLSTSVFTPPPNWFGWRPIFFSCVIPRLCFLSCPSILKEYSGKGFQKADRFITFVSSFLRDGGGGYYQHPCFSFSLALSTHINPTPYSFNHVLHVSTFPYLVAAPPPSYWFGWRPLHTSSLLLIMPIDIQVTFSTTPLLRIIVSFFHAVRSFKRGKISLTSLSPIVVCV